MIPKLNNNQLNRLSEFMANFGLVLFATVVAPLGAGIDKINQFMITSGLTLAIFSLFVSLWVLKGEKRR